MPEKKLAAGDRLGYLPGGIVKVDLLERHRGRADEADGLRFSTRCRALGAGQNGIMI